MCTETDTCINFGHVAGSAVGHERGEDWKVTAKSGLNFGESLLTFICFPFSNVKASVIPCFIRMGRLGPEDRGDIMHKKWP